MSIVDRYCALVRQAQIYRQRAETASAGSRQALETLAARHERTATQLSRRLT